MKEIISQENVKPSSPTPLENKIYKLSLFDQNALPIYIPIVLYYPNLTKHSCNNNTYHDHISQTTSLLKQSLSSTLSRFYPLAGRFKDSLTINCCDEGILFVVTKHTTCLSDFLKKPDPLMFRDHIPDELRWAEPEPGSYVAKIQVNFFDCGGIAIGLVLSHKIFDGATAVIFMKAWAGSNIGSGEEFYPDYKIKSLYPQSESMHGESDLFSVMKRQFKTGKTKLRRFVFDSSAMSKLREEVLLLLPPDERRPTRVEIVSAVIWKWLITASAKSSKKEGKKHLNSNSWVSLAVNMRKRAEPPLPETSFGNFVSVAPASVEIGNNHLDLKHLMMKVRGSVMKVDAGFITRMQGDEGFSGYYDNHEEFWKGFPEHDDYLAITSWCNFGLYGVDFGWGKPIWISSCNVGNDDEEMACVNMLWLMDTREGGGVEAWLTLDKNYMDELDDMFEEIKDLARVDPSPML